MIKVLGYIVLDKDGKPAENDYKQVLLYTKKEEAEAIKDLIGGVEVKSVIRGNKPTKATIQKFKN